MINNWQTFMNAVEAMRTAQKAYFRIRSSASFAEAKQLEAEVDTAIEQHKARTRPVQAELVFEQTQKTRPGLPVFKVLQGEGSDNAANKKILV